MRQGELIAFRLSDIDLEQNRITFRSPKTDDFRTLSIPTALKPIFAKLLTHLPLRSGWQERTPKQMEYVFCNQKGKALKTPGKDFMTEAAVRAGIKKHVTPHILRHSFGSHAANQVSTWELKELMGHKNISTSEIYVKNFKAPDVAVADKIAGSLGIDRLLVASTVGETKIYNVPKGARSIAPLLNQIKKFIELGWEIREKMVPEVGLEPT
jgi:integrase